MGLSAQETRLLSGRVFDDARDLPLTGILIMVEGTAEKSTSDWNGRFSMEVDATALTVQVAAAGYRPATVIVPAGTEDAAIDIRLKPLEIQMEEVSVTAEAEQPEGGRRFDEAAVEAIPTGGNPLELALSLPGVNRYSDIVDDLSQGFPGAQGGNYLRPEDPGIVFYGADPSWAGYYYGCIPIPRAMHFVGYPNPSTLFPRNALGAVEVYDLVAPPAYGALASGLVRLGPTDREPLAAVGIGLDSANLLGGFSSGGRSGHLSLHKSLFEWTIYPAEDRDQRRTSIISYSSNDYGKIKGNGGIVGHYTDRAIDGFSFSADALAAYDAGARVQKLVLDNSLESPQNIYYGLDGFAALGLEALFGPWAGTELGLQAAASAQGVDLSEIFHEEGSADSNLATEQETILRGRGHAYLKTAFPTQVLLQGGLSYDLQSSDRALWNLGDPAYPIHYLRTLDSTEPIPPEGLSASWQGTSHAIAPYAMVSWDGSSLSLDGSAGFLWQPERGLMAPLADARLGLSLPERGFTLDALAALRPQELSASTVTLQDEYLDTEGYSFDPVSTLQKAFSAGLRAEWGIEEGKLGASSYYRYFFDLSGYNLQNWYPHTVESSGEPLPPEYYPATDFILPHTDLGRSWGGTLSWTGTDDPYELSFSYALASTEYHSPEYGWVRANTDLRHALKALFTYRPNQVFYSTAQIGIFMDKPFTPVVVVRDEADRLYMVSGDPNSVADFVPRFKFDFSMGYSFDAFKGWKGKVYLDSRNLLSAVNPTLMGLKQSLYWTEGASSADFLSRVYDQRNNFTLTGTNFGLELRY